MFWRERDHTRGTFCSTLDESYETDFDQKSPKLLNLKEIEFVLGMFSRWHSPCISNTSVGNYEDDPTPTPRKKPTKEA